jgi:hypothetical protein
MARQDEKKNKNESAPRPKMEYEKIHLQAGKAVMALALAECAVMAVKATRRRVLWSFAGQQL